MKPVIQEETSGCGIAACAALANVTYAKAKRVANGLGIYAEDQGLWSDTAYVRRLLSVFQLKTASSEKSFTTWKTLPNKALLAIKWNLRNGYPFWHWVVFVRQGEESFVLDSKKNLKTNVRRDFGRMKPKWYIEVFD